MDEGFDANADASVDTGATADSTDIAIEPIADIPVEQPAMDNLNEIEPPISEPELAELQNEAAALEIQPLEEGADIEEPPYEPSALTNIINAGASGAASPSPWAQISGEIIAPPGAGEALAQGLQMAVNTTVEGSREFMDATVRQHGQSPAVALNEMQIHQAIDAASKPLEE